MAQPWQFLCHGPRLGDCSNIQKSFDRPHLRPPSQSGRPLHHPTLSRPRSHDQTSSRRRHSGGRRRSQDQPQTRCSACSLLWPLDIHEPDGRHPPRTQPCSPCSQPDLPRTRWLFPHRLPSPIGNSRGLNPSTNRPSLLGRHGTHHSKEPRTVALELQTMALQTLQRTSRHLSVLLQPPRSV